MSNNVDLSTFPANKVQYLTMLYLQNQNLSKLTPQELVDKYEEVHSQIRQQFISNRRSR